MPRITALLALALVTVAATGCGDEPAGDAAEAPKAGPAVVEGLERTTRVLDDEALAADALEPDGLASLLGEAEYEIGLEDEYSGRTELYAHVVSRQLEFEANDGAARYLDWLRSHASDLLGTARRAASIDVGADGFLTRDAGCGCHSDLPTYLAAWREGSTVRSLLADGPGVDRERFVALALELG